MLFSEGVRSGRLTRNLCYHVLKETAFVEVADAVSHDVLLLVELLGDGHVHVERLSDFLHLRYLIAGSAVQGLLKGLRVTEHLHRRVPCLVTAMLKASFVVDALREAAELIIAEGRCWVGQLI